MTCNRLLLIVFLLSSQFSFSQYIKLSGKITNNKLEPLALVSVKVKDIPAGTITREDGTYELKLEEGEYDLVVTMLGFKPQVIHFVLRKDYIQNIILEPDEAKNLSEVIVRGKAKDRSEEIIRQIIRHKENHGSIRGLFMQCIY